MHSIFEFLSLSHTRPVSLYHLPTSKVYEKELIAQKKALRVARGDFKLVIAFRECLLCLHIIASGESAAKQ